MLYFCYLFHFVIIFDPWILEVYFLMSKYMKHFWLVCVLLTSRLISLCLKNIFGMISALDICWDLLYGLPNIWTVFISDPYVFTKNMYSAIWGHSVLSIRSSFLNLIKPFRTHYNQKQQLNWRQLNIWPLSGYNSKAINKASSLIWLLSDFNLGISGF